LSTLAVDRLSSYFSQPITVDKDMACLALRAKMYVHDLPEGNFAFKIMQDATEVKSFPFTSLDLQQKLQLTDDYFWGDFAFEGLFFLTRGEYQIRLESSGYTFQESSFIGWVKDFEEIGRRVIGDPFDFSQYPFSFNLVEAVNREAIR
jgi:hypothetical protein